MVIHFFCTACRKLLQQKAACIVSIVTTTSSILNIYDYCVVKDVFPLVVSIQTEPHSLKCTTVVLELQLGCFFFRCAQTQKPFTVYKAFSIARTVFLRNAILSSISFVGVFRCLFRCVRHVSFGCVHSLKCTTVILELQPRCFFR